MLQNSHNCFALIPDCSGFTSDLQHNNSVDNHKALDKFAEMLKDAYTNSMLFFHYDYAVAFRSGFTSDLQHNNSVDNHKALDKFAEMLKDAYTNSMLFFHYDYAVAFRRETEGLGVFILNMLQNSHNCFALHGNEFYRETEGLGVFILNMLQNSHNCFALIPDCSGFTSDLQHNNSVDNHKALDKFAEMLKDAYTNSMLFFHYDYAVAFRRSDLTDPNGTPVGVSFTDDICSVATGKSSSIIEDQGGLGSDHDGYFRGKKCDPSNGFLMASIGPLAKTAFYFSQCTVNSIKENLL
ncbi:unnamed protein product [Mytilus coruscus]|uniref:Uncharacterized protein n=1 Tax=Mytilus coruscus TaxID=42192 RepID=A0A6J8D8C9_MYTCO|nr:unnamed protein product [Mytilus coruscus]